MQRPSHLSAFILAGGKSTRMGRDKAFVAHQGQALLQHALDLAYTLTSEVRVVGDREKFAGFPVVEDVFRHCGPLGGIHAALRASTTELNLMLAVDTPFVPPAFLRYLAAQARLVPDCAAVAPRPAMRWEPLCAIYRREFADAAEKALRAGQYKIGAVFDHVRVHAIEEIELSAAGFSADIFRNLNTPEDLAVAQGGK